MRQRGSARDVDVEAVSLEIIVRIPVQLETPDIVDEQVVLSPLPLEVLDHVRGLVVDHFVSSKRLAELDVGTGASRRDSATQNLGDLDATGAGPAAASVDEHIGSLFRVWLYTLIGCESSHPESGGICHAHAFGQLDDVVSPVDDDVLGERAEMGWIAAPEDQIAGDVRDFLTGLIERRMVFLRGDP